MRILLVILFFFLIDQISFGQQYSSKQEIHALIKTLKEKHYNPAIMDSYWSQKLFFKYLKSLDERHLYFLKPEIELLSLHKLNLNNELNNNQLIFIEHAAPVYLNSLVRAKKILEELRSKEWKLLKDEKYIPHHHDSLDYAVSETLLAQRWEKYFKIQVLIKDYQNRSDSTGTRPSLKDQYQKLIDKHLGIINNNILENKSSFKNLYYKYAKCIPLVFDPHSNYLSYTDFQNFQAMLSTEDYKFGITIELNKVGEIEIIRVTPGSPAWKSNKINTGDVITHLQWENKEKVDLSGMEGEEVIELLDQSNTLALTFTIKSATGTIQTLTLRKEKATSTENIVRGYILTGKNNKRIGYISLPSFYTKWESEDLRGCANDVAKELIKLQADHIDGLIFDLRNNGGGSLKEGVELSGIFLNEGAMAMQKFKDQPPAILKDWNRGSAYSGPMLVMINGHSASASELMASTLQDFNRAVVVGTDSYGKATGQELFSLNPFNNTTVDSLKSGYASVTVLKLYRVTGKSNQLSGVKPDITLPDPFINFYEKESKEPEALVKDSVSKKTYYQPLPALPISTLKAASIARVQDNEHFKNITQLAKKYKDVFDPLNQPILLQPENIKTIYENYIHWLEEVRINTVIESLQFEVNATQAENTLQQLSEEDRLLSEYSKKRIKNDIIIEESFLILNDLLK
jgi:carboxyl-terminal processing protease